MKKLIFIISIMLLSLIMYQNIYAYNPSDIADEILNFSPEIKADNKNIEQVLKDTFNYDPRLAMYYSGYKGSHNSFSSVINIIYNHKDVNVNNIYFAENKEEFINLITRALLYSDESLYIVAKNMPQSTTPVNDYIISVGETCPIAYMGYRGSNAYTLDTKIDNYTTYVIKFQYDFDKETLNQMKKDLEEKACQIVASNIAKNMPPYLKVYIVHNYIINNCKYAEDYETNSNPAYYTAYGALINGKAVCDGYASAAKILFDLCGIENIKVTGTSKGSGHAWNLINLDNEYYHIDTTWDDPVSYDGLNHLRYDYYNITDDKISQDHIWERENYPPAKGSIYTYKKTLELIKNSNESYNQGYTNFDSVFGKYQPLKGSTRYGQEVYTEYTSALSIEPDSVLDKAEDNLKLKPREIINYIIMDIGENPLFYIKILVFIILLFLFKSLFKRK